MRSPLKKRVLRDLKKDWIKYLVILILMSFMIGIASGVFVGNDSMMVAIDESYEKYNMEDGHFELKDEPTDELIEYFGKEVSLYEQFYKDAEELIPGKDEYKGVARLFKVREEVNLACLMDGRVPEKENEIAIDRAHGNNNGIVVGDKLKIDGKEYEVVGLIASPDYSSLFKNNSDTMFDAVNFDIAILSESGWDRVKENVKYQYAYKYDTPPTDDVQDKEWSDDLLEKLAVIAATGGYTSDKDEAEEAKLEDLVPFVDNTNEISDFVPGYANQSIQFAAKDLGKDQAMMNVLVYIFIAVLAFVFAITTGNKIREESAIIGTLRATGYTKGELIRFYMLIPVVITLLASIIGNILGYTYFKDVAVSLYYNSYSLLKFETLWNAKAFIITTLIPLALMVIVNFVVIFRLLKLSPMKFLRRDLSTSKRKKAVRLPAFKFFNRFRLRILIQNVFDYLTLFLGIVFIMVLLGFAIGFPETIDNYKGIVEENVMADYQTILKDYKDADENIITTKAQGAEEFSTTSLVTVDGVREDESITIYGYADNSKYFSLASLVSIVDELKIEGNEVYISRPFHDKFGYESGDEITLKEKYTAKRHTFTVKGIYEYPTGLAVFMPNDQFNEAFDNEKGSFTGYLSDERITDIDSEQIYTVITKDDMMTMARQLDHSMGGFADYISWACLIMGVLIMYLLTKIIIEKNAISISMVKVLGYTNAEISSLYVRLTTVVTVILTVAAAVLGLLIIRYAFRFVMYGMEGWLDLFISPMGVVKMILIVLAAYIVVSYLDMRHIKKIPLTEALKNVE
ncbi:MAG: ABC transporter permease [Firmicutes bacterium]|nr:ABC transporter permease [Bacillota bacterium]